MALEDLFKGMKAGRDMYFETEDSANRLAEQRLKLAAGEQIYADDQYVKPSQLADRLARHQYNEALAKANTATLSKLRPLQDTLNAAETKLGIAETGLKQEGFDQTRGTRLAEIIASAGNDLNKQSTVIPAQQGETVARANLNTSNDMIQGDINRLSRGEQVLAGVNSNVHKANTAQADAAESSQYMQWAEQNPEAFKRYNQDKIDTATQAAKTMAIHSLSGAELAEAQRIASSIDTEIRVSGETPDNVLARYSNSPDARLRNGAALYQKNKQETEQKMALEALKATAKSGGKSNTDADTEVAAQIAYAPGAFYEKMTGKKAIPNGNGSYLVNGELVERQQFQDYLANTYGSPKDFYQFAKARQGYFGDGLTIPYQPMPDAQTAVQAILFNQGFGLQDDNGLYGLNDKDEKVYAEEADRKRAIDILRETMPEAWETWRQSLQ